MNQYKTDARTGLQYELQGDYYVIAGEDEIELPAIGIWGQRHARWLRHNRRITYTNLLISGKLLGYLADIDRQAQEMFSRLIEQYAATEGITEQLKAEDQLAWVGRMNSIRERVEEIVLSELVYC